MTVLGVPSEPGNMLDIQKSAMVFRKSMTFHREWAWDMVWR